MNLSEAEIKVMKIIWNNDILPSGKLVLLCNNEFNWKKSTTYTILKRLEDKNAIKRDDSFVSAIYSRKEYENHIANELVELLFNNSIIEFIKFMNDSKK